MNTSVIKTDKPMFVFNTYNYRVDIAKPSSSVCGVYRGLVAVSVAVSVVYIVA